MQMTSDVCATLAFRESPGAINVESLVDRRGSPGILILALPPRILHMNERAEQMISYINAMENGTGHQKASRGLLPQALHQVCAEVYKSLNERTHVKDWERFEVKRLVGFPDHPLLVRGLWFTRKQWAGPHTRHFVFGGDRLPEERIQPGG